MELTFLLRNLVTGTRGGFVIFDYNRGNLSPYFMENQFPDRIGPTHNGGTKREMHLPGDFVKVFGAYRM